MYLPPFFIHTYKVSEQVQEAHDLKAFNPGSELVFFFSRAASISFLSIFGHKIAVLKSPALFQGKELQITLFKVMCF